MADIQKLIPFILRWEGGYVNDSLDKGGATNKGVTIATWKAGGYDIDGDGDIDENDVKLISEADFGIILRKYYWDKWKADLIISQSIANIVVDWTWGSGSWGIRIPQRILGVKEDGIVGQKTIDAINETDPFFLFLRLKDERIQFIDNIIKNNPKQMRFKMGWYNRINALKYAY
jgi:lysozyme family protein